MPARHICQNFFRDVLAHFHKYRQNALLDTTVALISGASLTLTSIGRHLPGSAQVKNKIKRVDRLLGKYDIDKNRGAANLIVPRRFFISSFLPRSAGR
ncbi:hypothetical protein NT01EI_1391 [Edwardsiella ictaluri 93-146]|uniref:Transposase n=1 Tax=Edwardsiella ictaluri (strain 93-146) TaxID=634503 RepID=C5BD86_EDWI9|nr:hypothetical protein NT01EI_1391 [Edwardsiella ictaluri 93-146]STP88171.1 Uncharacterised protein [Edwardsiella ictaluri]